MTSHNMTKKNKRLIDLLANLEHEQWSHWTDYFYKNDTSKNRDRWNKQMKTSYFKLSEKEKESDRKWARKVLMIIRANLHLL